jgi:hypothetical protein
MCHFTLPVYNDTVATGDNDRLALTNQALKELLGVNDLPDVSGGCFKVKLFYKILIKDS